MLQPNRLICINSRRARRGFRVRRARCVCTFLAGFLQTQSLVEVARTCRDEVGTKGAGGGGAGTPSKSRHLQNEALTEVYSCHIYAVVYALGSFNHLPHSLYAGTRALLTMYVHSRALLL